MPISWSMISNVCGRYKIEFQEYFTYNILYGYIIFNDGRGYGVLEHLIGCLGVYVLQYYHRLEVAYNKYLFTYTIVVSHKPNFVMARRDFIQDAIENKAKEDTIETRY